MYIWIVSFLFSNLTSSTKHAGTSGSLFRLVFLDLFFYPLSKKFLFSSYYCLPLCILYKVYSVCLLTGAIGCFKGLFLLIWGANVHYGSSSWVLLNWRDSFLLCRFLWKLYNSCDFLEPRLFYDILEAFIDVIEEMVLGLKVHYYNYLS